MTISGAVVEIIAEVLTDDPYEIEPGSELEADLGAEQEDLEAIAAELSSRFEIDVPVGVLEGKTVQQIIDYVREEL